MDYILGVDGGGTKTVIRIADTTGKTVSEHICGAGNYKSVGIESAEENISKGIFTAMAAIDINAEDIYFRSSCFGLSGLDCENDKAIFEKYFKNVLEAKLKVRFPNIIFKPLNDKPVSGAIKLALRNL